MRDIGKYLAIGAQIVAYILAAILIVQMIKTLRGGSWNTEDLILIMMSVNLTLTFGMGGYLFRLNNKISAVDKKIHGHIEWHKGRESREE